MYASSKSYTPNLKSLHLLGAEITATKFGQTNRRVDSNKPTTCWVGVYVWHLIGKMLDKSVMYKA